MPITTEGAAPAAPAAALQLDYVADFNNAHFQLKSQLRVQQRAAYVAYTRCVCEIVCVLINVLPGRATCCFSAHITS